MDEQVVSEVVADVVSESKVAETPVETKRKTVKTVVKKNKKRVRNVSKTIVAVGNGWTFPVNLRKNIWYLAMYFADSTPYTVRFDGFNFRDCYGKLIPVPVRVKPVDVFVPSEPEKE